LTLSLMLSREVRLKKQNTFGYDFRKTLPFIKKNVPILIIDIKYAFLQIGA